MTSEKADLVADPKRGLLHPRVPFWILIVLIGLEIAALWILIKVGNRAEELGSRGQKFDQVTQALILVSDALIAVAFVAMLQLMPHLRGLWRMSGAVKDQTRLERAWESLQKAEIELSKRTAAGQLVLPALWDVTHKRLEYYHLTVVKQARYGFWAAQVTMILGVVLLAVLGYRAMEADDRTIGAIAAALGVASLGFAGFISRTFVRSQEAATQHLRAFFDQPVEFSRFLAAERLINGAEGLSSDQKAAAVAEIAKAIVAPPSPNAAGQPEGERSPGV